MFISTAVARCLSLFATVLVIVALPAAALADTAFAPRYDVDLNGDFAFAGNSLTTCVTGVANCATAQAGGAYHNQSFANSITWIDVDGDASTFDSSRATLATPGGTTIAKALLYWFGDTTSGGGTAPAAPSPALKDQVKLMTPGATAYSAVTGTVIGGATAVYAGSYVAVADVTSQVQAAGNGTYTVANVQLGTGANRAGGWSLVVVYQSPTLPFKSVTIYDGAVGVQSPTGAATEVAITITGFKTPPAGTVKTQLGAIAYEGDRSIAGDYMTLSNGSGADVRITNTLNPGTGATTDFFNSSVTNNNVAATTRDPAYANTLGVDIDTFDISGLLGNSQTSTTAKFGTTGDAYMPVVLAFSTELYAPSFSNAGTTKTASDVNGGDLRPGDVIEYTVAVKNTGQDSAVKVALSDAIPANTTYVPGTLEILSGANTGVKGDATTPADQADYDSAGNKVVFRLGTGADGTNGGTLAINDSTSVRFRVKVNPGTANGTLIQNTASMSFAPGTSPTRPLTTTTNTTQQRVVATANLAAKKTVAFAPGGDANGNGIAEPGETVRYTIVTSNSGDAAATNVLVTDTPGANTTLVVGSVTPSALTTKGNTAGDTSVRVAVPSIAASASQTVTFDVKIATPLPAGVTSVANQAAVVSDTTASVLSDDPSTAAPGDPTALPVTAQARITLTKRDAVVADNDGSGGPSPGDQIRYTIVVTNVGNQASAAQTVTDTPDANAPLIVGSVTTTAGAVNTGNTAGDTSVKVSVPALAGGGASATITFDVLVVKPLPAGVSQIANQAAATGGGVTVSDDPDTTAGPDATVTPLAAAPTLVVTKKATLATDADGDGKASPGDQLLYSISVSNTGNQNATAVALSDIPDPVTTLVVGSVGTTIGSVVTGNTAGHTSVKAAIGTLPGGSAATVSFKVTVADPLPAGITTASNQALVESKELPIVASDDPSTAAAADPTVTPLSASPRLASSKTVKLAVDADADGKPSPGDTLAYAIQIVNSGNGAATGVTFSDGPDANTKLVNGSVSTTVGSVAAGNGAGDTSLAAAIGTLAGRGGAATVSFQATIVDPFPGGTTRVANQGIVRATGVAPVPTDDPSTVTGSDPTLTTVSLTPKISTTKRVKLFEDADGDGVPSPGDTLVYVVEIRNDGNAAATGLGFTDTPDANTTLVVGSVVSDTGAVSRGNSVGDTSVGVSIGALAGRGGSASISFKVVIADPLPAGVTSVANQGTTRGDGLPTSFSDDPDTKPAGDPTVTPLSAKPVLGQTKSVKLVADADGDGIADPGDTLLYDIEIRNSGNQDAAGVRFYDVPDPLTNLVVGSVTTSLGSVVTGNGAGDGSIEVDVGAIGGRATATITFEVTVVSPLPAGAGEVVNQGVVKAENAVGGPTDDPSTPDGSDPTRFPVGGTPLLRASKSWVIASDADGDGVPSPGDILEYAVVVRNDGDQAATGIAFADTPGAGTALVPGTVAADTGPSSVTLGNGPGDTSVGVAIGELAGGASAAISFRVAIDDPAAAGVTSVANQGSLAADGLPAVRSDDPAVAGSEDPTVTPIVASPKLIASKADVHLTDADGDGVPSPGDRIEYVIDVTNTGNAAAADVAIADTPDVYAPLVAGSVATTLGSVTAGNGTGDGSVAVDVGTLPGRGGSVRVTFTVQVVDPLPVGITSATNQATITSSNAGSLVSDDPAAAGGADPTVTPLTSAPVLEVTKADALVVDGDGDGVAEPGDTLEYTIDIANSGNGAATGVVFTDTPDANAPLVAGSVRTSLGAIDLGNGGADTSVTVTVGDLAGRTGHVRITFRVQIASPLPAGVSQIANQGLLQADGVAPMPTDDPATPGADDPTVTPITAAPILHVTKVDSLFVDADGDGVPSPGDTVAYTLVVRNDGNQAATTVALADTPGAHTALVVGSVTTDRGTVSTGNTAGDGSLAVAIGTLPGGASAQVGFQVTIADPLGAGIIQIANQAVATADGIAGVLSDDPAYPAGSDPTLTPVTAAPALSATKTDVLVLDANGNGLAEPGDMLQYAVVLTNSGNGAATGVAVADTPDANTTLVAGSVTTTAGSVTLGNTTGDAAVGVDVGTLGGRGGTVTVTFRAAIVSPLPAGVTQVANQAVGTAANAPDVRSDDPAAPGAADPTLTPITAAPILDVAKRDTVLVDGDGDGAVSPGDTLLYTITVANLGNQAAADVTVDDTPGAHTTLVVGSVEPAALATVGNAAGDTSVSVALGTLAGGATTTVTFAATIADPLPAGVTQVANQALVSATNAVAATSDDPDSATADDPTVTALSATPALSSTKRDTFVVDADGDGVVSAGDTLRYRIDVVNSGNQEATDIALVDTPDGLTTLVVGSVTTTVGSVTAGNGAGDSSLGVSIPSLAGRGGTATIEFDVRIADPLPAGSITLSNQAAITSTNAGGLVTDDPDRGGSADPTTTVVSAAPALASTKTDTLAVDADGDGVPSPGDTLLYTVTLRNDGNAAASDVVVADTPDVNAPLVAGSVATTLGTVAVGNTAGDGTVRVDAGTLPGRGGTVIVTFRVTVVAPLPLGVRDVSNQAVATATAVPATLSDDPAAGSTTDPTVTPLTAAPVLSLTKRDSVLVDADGSGGASPGDTLLYTLVARNAGNAAAGDVVVTDTPGAYTTLVAGSVTTDAGTVATGASAGDTSVSVAVGTLPGGAEAHIAFQVVIADPLPAGIATVANQATIAATDAPAVASDDPDTLAGGDPTVTPVTSAPLLTVAKRDTLLVDNDGDGMADPGDTLLYTVTVVNAGNGEATNVTITDAPDPNTALVVGAVATSAGSVTTGNVGGDTSVGALIGSLAGRGGSATVTFQVTLDDPVAAGVGEVANQAIASATGVPAVPSDDPDTATTGDPTITPIVAAPVLAATKRDQLVVDADGDGVPSPGDTILYEVEIANVGNQTASGVEFVDTPDAHAPLVAGTVVTDRGLVATGNTAGDTTVAVLVGPIPGGGASARISFQATIVDPLPAGVTQVANQGVASASNAGASTTDDPDTTTAGDPTATPLQATPVLAATKSATLAADNDGDGVPSAGDDLIYRITLVNSGGRDATGVSITDAPDAAAPLVAGTVVASVGTVTTGSTPGDTTVAVSVGTLAGRGGTVVVTFRVRIANPLPAGVTDVANQAVFTSTNAIGGTSDDPATLAPGDPTVTTVAAVPRLVATKSDSLVVDADGNGVPSPGDTLAYTVVVENVGNRDAADVVFRDVPDVYAPLVAGTVTTSLGTIGVGNGPGDGQVDVAIGTLGGGGARATITFRVQIVQPLPDGVVEVANQATISSSNAGGTVSDDPGTLAGDDPTRTPLTAQPLLAQTKQVALVGDADGDGTVDPGDTLRYRIDVTNSGNQDATTVVVSDTPGTNLVLVSGSVLTTLGTVVAGNGAGQASVRVDVPTLAGAGGTLAITFDARVGNPLPAGVTQVANQALVAAANAAGGPTDDPTTGAADDPTVTRIGSSPHLSVTKAATLAVDADGDGIPSAGDTLQYTIQVASDGDVGVANVVMDDTPDPDAPLVAGSVATTRGTVTTGNGVGDGQVVIDLGTLPSGSNATITFDVQVRDPLAAGVTQVANQAIVSGDGVTATPSDDPSTAASSDATVTAVGAAPLLRTTKAASLQIDRGGDGKVSPGDTVRYTIVVTNDGNIAETGVVVADTPGAGSHLVPGSVVTSLGTIVRGNGASDGDVRVEVAGLAGRGGVATVSFAVVLDDPFVGARVSNQGTVAGAVTGDHPTDDPTTTATDDPTVLPVAAFSDLVVTKTVAVGSVYLGDQLVYTIAVRNAGPNVATGVTVDDALPAGLELLSAAPTQGTCAAGPPLSCAIGQLAVGASATIVVTTVTRAEGIVVNTASVRSEQSDPDPANSSSSVTAEITTPAPVCDDGLSTPVRPGPGTTPCATKLAIKKRALRRAVTAGDSFTYTIVVTNVGKAVARDIEIRDPLPAGLTFVRAPGATFRKGAAVWHVARLKPGQRKVLRIRVRATQNTTIRRATNTATARGSNARSISSRAAIRIREDVSPANGGGGVTG